MLLLRLMTPQQREDNESAAAAWAKQIGVPYLDSRTVADIKPLYNILQFDAMSQYGIVPVKLTDKNLTLAINDKTDRTPLESIKPALAPYEVHYVLISMVGWQQLYNRYDIGRNISVLDSGDFSSFSSKLDSSEPKLMLEVIAQLAFQLVASDIHVEPGATEARLRFRIDGVLHPVTTMPLDRYQLFTSDLQTRAGATWGADKPQSGRIEIDLINDLGEVGPINLRLETIPSLHGEDVVIRIFNLTKQFINLDALHLSDDQRQVVEEAIAHPRGLVLTVGPTGSGKTSALYSIINSLNTPETKIVTLEDPIEYELEGISQLPVHSEDAEMFMEKLRAVLREDPNVIMIGEIRDADTAKTALQAALTGHLVLSTFHAVSASAAISRLMDMVGQDTLLASAIKLIMAQRLVRRLCDKCKSERQATDKEIQLIRSALDGLPDELQPKNDNINLQSSTGCSVCHHYGYNGRIALIEQLIISESIQGLITQDDVTAQIIEAKARQDGMITLLQDGIIKALQGHTTLEEVYVAVG